MDNNNKILLHSCCACCLTHSILALREEGYEVIVYFYNPQIYPENEYDKRIKATIKYCKDQNSELIIGEYNSELFENLIRTNSLEKEPENGKRCIECYKLRLENTAKTAKELNIDLFTTTLTISPHKDVKIINNIGTTEGDKMGIKYLQSNFKKMDGYLKSIKLSKEHGLYRQNYCGCKYSIREDLKTEDNIQNNNCKCKND